MTTQLQYIGNEERYFETAVTGKSRVWSKGRIAEVSDGEAVQLLGTGLFRQMWATPVDEQGTPRTLSSSETGIVRSIATTRARSFSSGAAVADVQAAAIGGNCMLAFVGDPGTVIELSAEVLLDDYTTILIGEGVEVRKVGTGGTQVFGNREKTAGNTDIRILGLGGTINGNREAVTATSGWSIRNWNAVQFISVRNLYVGGWMGKRLHIKDPYKYLLHCGALRDFHFADIHFSSAGAAEPGQDGIHLAGLSRKGIIERIFGSCQDDLIAINPRAVPLAPNETMPQAMGPIRELVIRDIYGSTQDRAGNVVALYGCIYDDAAQTVFDGAPDAASPSSTKPAITGITYSGSIATVTTNKPHRMVEGDMFTIASANPAAYNTGLGLVIDAPTPTTFRYFCDTAGAYVGSATLTIYWHLDDITVENVRGDVHQSCVLNLQPFGEASQSLAVFRGIKARGITGNVTSARSAAVQSAVMNWASALVIDSEFDGIGSSESEFWLLWSATTVAGKSTCGTRGAVTVRGFSGKSNYQPNQSAGHGHILLATGLYQGLTIEGFHFRSARTTGAWRHGISASLGAGSDLVVRRCSVSGVQLATNNIISVAVMDATCLLTLEDCGASNGVESLVDVKDGAGVTGGTVVVRGGFLPSGSTAAVTCYANGVNIILTGGFDYRATTTPVRFLGTSANCTLKIDDTVRYSNAVCATITGTGPYAITGLGARIDVADAKVSRVNGAIVYNSNAAAGTLGAAGLVVGQGTAAGSWKLLANPASASF